MSGLETIAKIFLKGHHYLNQRLPEQFQDKHCMLSGKEARIICVKGRVNGKMGSTVCQPNQKN